MWHACSQIRRQSGSSVTKETRNLRSTLSMLTLNSQTFCRVSHWTHPNSIRSSFCDLISKPVSADSSSLDYCAGHLKDSLDSTWTLKVCFDTYFQEVIQKEGMISRSQLSKFSFVQEFNWNAGYRYCRTKATPLLYLHMHIREGCSLDPYYFP